MAAIAMPPEEGGLALDVCLRCQGVWFDPGEYAAVSRTPPEGRQELSPQAREALARMEITRTTEEDEETGGPQEAWKHLPAAFGLPVQVDTPPPAARPWATWIVAGAIVIAFLASLIDLRGAVRDWGFLPDEAWRAGGLTILTSFFLHGGLWHLLGNLYFFVVFGDDVEDRLGRGRFLLLLLLGHLAGVTLHAAYDPHPEVPLVGASGGIFAVIAYFAVSTPKARLAFLWIVRGGAGWVRTPALTLLFLYIGLQLFGAWQQLHGYATASALGHLGGLAVGVVAALAPRLRDRVEGRESPPEA
jgi:membrane associated rhomboid family serine protease